MSTHAFLSFLFGVGDSAVDRNIDPLQAQLAGQYRISEQMVKLE